MNGLKARVRIDSLKKRLLRLDPGSEDVLKALGGSFLVRPMHDVMVRASDMLVADGNRRLLGLELLGETEVDVLLIDGDLTDADLDKMAWVSAFHRAPLGGYEQACVARSIKAGPPPLNNKELAAVLNIDDSMPTKMLALFDCIPEVQEAAKAGLIGLSDWYAIRKSDDQLYTHKMKLAGATRDELEQHNKKSKGDEESKGTEKPGKNDKAASIKVVVGGVTVTIKKKGDLSLDEAIKRLPEVLKELERAKKDGHDAKTLAALMKKRARS